MAPTECPTDQDLTAFSLGELEECALERVATHVEGCSVCEQMLSKLDSAADVAIRSLRAAPEPEPRRIGDYDLLEEIGRGGLGVVYRARHRTLGRQVALKMLLGGQFAAGGYLERFRAEARAVAHLAHPHIVPLYDSGEHDGQPYFAMEFVDGGSLGDRAGGKPQPPAQAARWLATLARAVQYAHEHGLIHRDLKPSNVLLTRDGQVKVCDFGVAKHLEDAESKTQTGQLVGTPEYMAPEQAGGLAARVGPAADVYSLGAILYTLLTGRPPFQGAAMLDTLDQVRTRDPVPPSRLQPWVPRDLSTICLKCLDKASHRRYPSAAALADDMDRFLGGRPIRARPAGALERGWKWARRRPALAALLLVLLLVGSVGFPGAVWLWLRAARAYDAERDQRIRAEQAGDAERRQRLRAEHALYASRITLAHHALEAGDVAAAAAELAKCEPEPGRPDLRAWEWHYLKAQCEADLLPGLGHFDRPMSWARALAWRPDGARFASGAGLPFGLIAGYPDDAFRRTAGEVKVWDAGTGRCVATLAGHGGSVWTVAYSPDGKLLASGGSDGSIRLRDAETHEERPGPPPYEEPVWAVAFTPDSRRLAVASQTRVMLWDLAAARPRWVVPNAAADAHLAFAPDGTRLAATSGSEGSIRILRVEDGTELSNDLPRAPVTAAAWSPAGDRLALAYREEPRIDVWDGAGKTLVCHLEGHRSQVNGLTFRGDGQLISAGDDKTVRVWRLDHRKEEFSFRGHEMGVLALALSPDGTRLVSGGKDQAVKVWDAGRDPRGLGVRPLVGGALGEWLHGLTFAADDRLLLVESSRAALAVRAADAVTGTVQDPPAMQLGTRAASQMGFAFSARGRRVAGRDADDPRVVRIWDTARGLLAAVRADEGAVGAVALSADGELLAYVVRGRSAADARGYRSRVVLAEAATGHTVRELAFPGRLVMSVAFSPDRRRLALASAEVVDRDGGLTPADETDLHLSDPATDADPLVISRAHEGGVSALGFSPDGRQLASGGVDQAVRVWEAATGAPCYPPLAAFTVPTGVAFSPDGRRLAATGPGSRVRLWDADTGNELLVLGGLGRPDTGHYGFTARVMFSPDGRRLAANGADGTISVWTAEERAARKGSP
jgi:WD40 repeat protein